MTQRRREPDFDIDLVIGKQAELWVADLRRALSGTAEIEIKAPKPFLKEKSFYVETWCRRSTGWKKSGINTTKAKLHIFAFGSLIGGLVVETSWLKRAAKRAWLAGHVIECKRGSHPTKGVLVSLDDLYETRESEP
jgi:hypothetical protein